MANMIPVDGKQHRHDSLPDVAPGALGGRPLVPAHHHETEQHGGGHRPQPAQDQGQHVGQRNFLREERPAFRSHIHQALKPVHLRPEKGQQQEAEDRQRQEALEQIGQQRGHQASRSHVEGHHQAGRQQGNFHRPARQSGNGLGHRQSEGADEKQTQNASQEGNAGGHSRSEAHLEDLGQVEHPNPLVDGGKDVVDDQADATGKPEPDSRQAAPVGRSADHHRLRSPYRGGKDVDECHQRPPFAPRGEEVTKVFGLPLADHHSQKGHHQEIDCQDGQVEWMQG